MKIHILYRFIDGPYGGGNQFLKALRAEWMRKGQYSDELKDADAVLLNAFPTNDLDFFIRAIELKKNKGIPIFYRLDGLFYRNRLDKSQVYIDTICRDFANKFCDGIIYQTDWVKQIQQEFGVSPLLDSTTVLNAPDSRVFNKDKKFPQKSHKTRLVSTCWAPNKRKGFETYQWLDEHLDFNSYDFTFIGNSPVSFNNIKTLPPLPSEKLSEEIGKHDIFISAAFDEPCSNSLIEALHVGLPAVGHNSGGTPQIVGLGGELFSSYEELLLSINRVSSDIETYQSRISLPYISDVADAYYAFIMNSKARRGVGAKEFESFKKLLSSATPKKVPLPLKIWAKFTLLRNRNGLKLGSGK